MRKLLCRDPRSQRWGLCAYITGGARSACHQVASLYESCCTTFAGLQEWMRCMESSYEHYLQASSSRLAMRVLRLHEIHSPQALIVEQRLQRRAHPLRRCCMGTCRDPHSVGFVGGLCLALSETECTWNTVKHSPLVEGLEKETSACESELRRTIRFVDNWGTQEPSNRGPDWAP